MKTLIISIIFLSISLLLNAQTDSLETYMNMSLEELLNVKITTAGKQEQQVKDIPSSVVIITRADIETYGYRTLSEILENISGMYMTNDYSIGGTNFGVRGYWSVIPNNNLMIFVNDVDHVCLPYSSYQLDEITVPVEAIERIEVIRGPMSVLYGSGAFFGVVNIFTQNVNTEKSATNVASGSLGTQQTGKASLRISNNSKDFNYTLNASVFKSSGIDQPYSKMNDNTSIFKTSSTKDLLKQQELYFGFNAKLKHFYTDFSYNESNNGLMFLFPSAGSGSIGDVRSTTIAVGYKNNISDKWIVDGKLTYYNSFRKANFDVFFQNVYEYQDLPSKAYDADLTINSNLTKQLHLTVGAKFRSILSVENNLHLPTNGFGFFYNTTQTIDDNNHIDSWAGFAQVDYQLFEKLKFIAGGRMEQRLDFTLKTVEADTLFGKPANVFREKYSQQDLQFIPRLAAIFSITNNHIIKLLYGKAINTPSWFQIINGGAQRLNLHSEEIQSYELNYIASPFPKLLINTSVFYNLLNDLIVRTIGVDDQGIFYTYNSNTGKVETKGMELTLQIKPMHNMDIEVSGTYQKTIDLGHKNITYNYSPNLLGNLKMSYHFNSHLNTSIVMNYVDKMETNWLLNPDGTGKRIGNQVPAYYTIGANVRFTDIFNRGLYFELHGTNLLNQDIMYPATANNNSLFPKGTVGMGRQIMFSLGYKF